MNYYEYRLEVIQQAIPLLKEKENTEDLINTLKEEQQAILQQIQGG